MIVSQAAEDDEDMLLTVSLLMAVLVAVTAQFLVGYNLGVMNAPTTVATPLANPITRRAGMSW